MAKSGLTDLKSWLNTSFGQQTPWGTHDAEVLVTEVVGARARALDATDGGGDTDVIRLREGDVVVEQGQRSTSVLVLLDGVLAVEVDGLVAELGPGAVVGERAGLEEASGRRRCAARRRSAWPWPAPTTSTATASSSWPRPTTARTRQRRTGHSAGATATPYPADDQVVAEDSAAPRRRPAHPRGRGRPLELVGSCGTLDELPTWPVSSPRTSW